MAKTKALDLSGALDAAQDSTGLQVEELGNSDPFLPDNLNSFPDVPQGEGEPSIPVEPAQESAQPEQATVGETIEESDTPLSFADINLGGPSDQPVVESDGGNVLQEIVEVPNVGLVPVHELVNGYLRQADYTQKTQEIAETRRLAESDEFRNVQQLYQMLREDTVGTVQKLAAEVGITDAVTTGERVLPQFNQINEEQIQQLIDQRVAERLQSTPQLQEIERQQRVAQINNEMTRIESQYGEQFSDADKVAILDNAVKSGTGLELTYMRMKHALQEQEAARSRVGNASNRTQRTANVDSDPKPPQQGGVAGAYERALFQLQSE